MGNHLANQLSMMDGVRFVEAMAARGSIPPRQLTVPGLSNQQRDLILKAALASPSHGGLRNFRFVSIGDERRDALADVFLAAKQEENPAADAEDLRRARDKAYHAPTLILLVARVYSDHPDIPAIEQIASAGVALGAVLHAAHALGFGAMAVSGDKLATRTLRDAFKLETYEHALAFIAVGTPSKPPREKQRAELSVVLQDW
jgi:nitroreductase